MDTDRADHNLPMNQNSGMEDVQDESSDTSSTVNSPSVKDAAFTPIQSEPDRLQQQQSNTRPGMNRRKSSLNRPLTQDDIVRSLTRRRSAASTHSGDNEDLAQIAGLISRMFGQERKANSNEEKTRHLGVVWKNLTVKGVGLGSAIQPTNSDILLGIPRIIKNLIVRGRNKAPLRTIIDDFTVCLLYRKGLIKTYVV